jgi:hypothetical protein
MKRKIKTTALLICGFLMAPLAAFADNGGIVSVPESATMILMGAGLVGLAVLGRKRFKK